MPLSQGRVWTRLREALSTASPSTWSEDLRALLVSSLCPLPRHGAGTQNLLFIPYHELNHKACSRPIFSPPLSYQNRFHFAFVLILKGKHSGVKTVLFPTSGCQFSLGGKKKPTEKQSRTKPLWNPTAETQRSNAPLASSAGTSPLHGHRHGHLQQPFVWQLASSPAKLPFFTLPILQGIPELLEAPARLQSTAQQKAHVSKEPEREEAPCYPNVLRHRWTHRWTHTIAARTSYNLFIDFAYL